MPDDAATAVSTETVRIVFVSLAVSFFVLGFLTRRFVLKHDMNSVIDYYDLAYASAGPTMGILAIWAAIDDSVLDSLPLDYMLVFAGLASIAFGMKRLFDPVMERNNRTGSGRGELDLPESNEEDASAVLAPVLHSPKTGIAPNLTASP